MYSPIDLVNSCHVCGKKFVTSGNTCKNSTKYSKSSLCHFPEILRTRVLDIH